MEGVSAPPKKGPGLYDFLVEAELQQYFNTIKNQLKLSHPSQLKFVTESDLAELGMSKPEARRLRKYYDKHFPHNYLSKFKRLLSTRKPESPSLYAVPPGSPKESDGTRPLRVPSKHIIPPDSITVNKELGMGEFGIVQQGVWSNERERIQVAIKCLARERMQSNPIEFLKEAAIMHSIDHSHIVRLYGVVLDTDSLMLVTELAPLRSLLECLKEPSLRLSFPVLTLCDFAMQVCDGMQYLEVKRLIHRDLAARNILVFSKNKVKISDFGLSRALGQGRDYYQSKFNVNLKLPIAWCAPECISYLRFTSASDVWAFGVCLWEMFSYGFQPWAALTGHQILEAIDEPNLQRLEQPDCCPQEYYALMRDCWRHEALARPRFADLYTRLADIRPEQVQAKIASPEGAHLLPFRVGDVVTVLDKVSHQPLWKGVIPSGKTGLFNPANVVTYLGNLPSARPEPFQRSDSRSSSRRKLRTEMISGPQGDCKHTGHVGLDGAYFGDLSFLGGSKTDYNLIPKQVVTPYKPHEDLEAAPLLEGAPLHISDHLPLPPTDDHLYHEISDEELPVTSPHFDTLDFGPSLLAEMEHAFHQISLGAEQPPHSPADHEGTNKCNELRELSSRLGKQRKQATVKPISATDKKTLDTAIALAKDISARSMNDLESEPVPTTPVSPTKRKFSFRFPSSHEQPERRNFSEEAQSSPDLLQSTLTQEAQLAYESLVETPSPDVVQPHFFHTSRPRSAQSENPLRLLRSGPLNVIKPRVRTFHATSHSTLEESSRLECQEVDESDNRRQSLDLDTNATDENPIPLPPRDRNKVLLTSKPRHTRKHPLIIPATSNIQRTLDKVNQLTPEDKSNDEDIPKFIAEPNEHCYVNHKILEDDAESIHFEEQIDSELAALDEIPEDCTLRHHVSCEDLLEFADARPSPRERGNDSDEVRIMSKVLGADVSTEQCLLALEHSDWDVHKAIKLSKLQTLVRISPGNLFVDLATCGSALKTANWDLSSAASLIISAHQDDVTQV